MAPFQPELLAPFTPEYSVSGDFVEISKIERQSAEVEITYPNGVRLKVGADLSLLSQLIRLY